MVEGEREVAGMAARLVVVDEAPGVRAVLVVTPEAKQCCMLAGDMRRHGTAQT